MRSLRNSGPSLRLGLPLAVAVALALLARLGQPAPPEPVRVLPEPRLADAAELGSDRGAGNLVGIQPYMLPHDYASKEAFQAKLAAYFAAADDRGWLGEGTVVVLPEYLGTWLVALDESAAVYRARSVTAALRPVVWRRLSAFTRAWWHSAAEDRMKAALFRAKAETMAAVYQQVFSRLAAEHRVTVVAGSLVLPSPRLDGGRLVPGDGPLYNVSAVFSSAGAIVEPLVRKVYPISDELAFTAPASVGALPVFDSPSGRLGVLICADSWYPRTWKRLREQGVELVAVPSYLAGDGAWSRPWAGYDGADAPADIDAADIGTISEGEAWLKYALAGRMAGSGARAGLNVFLRGELWGLGSDGRAVLVRGGTVRLGRHVEGAGIYNVWL